MGSSQVFFWIFTLAIFAALFMMGRRYKLKLWVRVMAGLAGGVLGALFFGGGMTGCADPGLCAPAQIGILGDAFVRLIRMLIVPLIVVTLAAGIVKAGDIRALGLIGMQSVGLYMGTTVVAVSLGLLMGSIIRPGAGMTFEKVTAANVDAIKERLSQGADGIADRVLAIIPDNPVMAMAEGDVLALVFFALLLGVGVLKAGAAGAPFAGFLESASTVVLRITDIVMSLAPYGVYALMAKVVSLQGLVVLAFLAKLVLALYGACLLHILFTYGGMVRLLAGLPVAPFFKGMFDAQAVAYSTSSSSATLPVTIANVTRHLGVDKEVAGTVLPVGATVNMDGTSIYLGIVALFAAQALGISPQWSDYLLIAFTATLASIGTAGIPSASLFLAVTVLSIFKDDSGLVLIGPEQALIVVAFLFPFDRLLDMMRTVTNVTGDAAVSLVVGRWQGVVDEKVYRARNVKAPGISSRRAAET